MQLGRTNMAISRAMAKYIVIIAPVNNDDADCPSRHNHRNK
jgi:hypothetical protein